VSQSITALNAFQFTSQQMQSSGVDEEGGCSAHEGQNLFQEEEFKVGHFELSD